MRLTDRLLAAVYRALRNANRKERRWRANEGLLIMKELRAFDTPTVPPPPAPPDYRQTSSDYRF